MRLPAILFVALWSASIHAQTTQPSSTTAPTPVTMPHDVWIDSPLSRTILHAFDTAPYPHASRAQGFTNSKGEAFPREGHYDDSTVGIVVPAGFVKGETVDFVVHFHGHRNDAANVLADYKLEEQLRKANVNAILLVPQGPKHAPDSGGGKLELDEDGFKRFIADVTRYLNQQGVIETDRVGNIALSAHSGGYKTTASILHRGGMNDHISDVILLDASYGNLDYFAAWANAHRDKRLVSFHTRHLDDENVLLQEALKKTGTPFREIAETDLNDTTASPRGVSFIATTLSHKGVLGEKDYLALMLRTSGLMKRR